MKNTTDTPQEFDPRLIEVLKNVIDPELRKDIVTLEMVARADIDTEGTAHVKVTLTVPGCPRKADFTDGVTKEVLRVEGVKNVSVTFGVMDDEQRENLRKNIGSTRKKFSGLSVPEKCRIIAVTSGKGGVGKSTLTVNLAAAMQQKGYEVGVLDADVYGYSAPKMLGIHQRPVTVDNMIVPPTAHDLRVMSIGFFLDEDAAVIWRGPMLHRALEQFLGDVHWGDIDYLFIDMPPGTGDIAISLAKLLPRSECLVVTTPQPAAQQVARRSALSSFKLDQMVLGVIENMSGEGEDSMFGEGGGELLAEELAVPLFGKVPLDKTLRLASDAGKPATLGDSEVAKSINEIATQIDSRRPAETKSDPATRIKKPLEML